jgi:biopolymer transport protein ExbD
MKLDNFSRNDRKITLNLTSLIDVLFLLIIFFAVSTQFKEIPALDLNLPEAGASEAQSQTAEEIWVGADGAIFFGAQPVTADSLGSIFFRLSLRDSTGVVVLKADEKAPYGTLIKIMDQAQLNGFQNLILATDEE